MTDIPDDIDLEADKKATVGDLTLAIAMTEKLIGLYKEVDVMSSLMKAKAEEIHQIESQSLPELMDSCGATTLPLLSGGKIELKNIVKASLPSCGAIEKAKEPEKKAELQTRLKEGLEWLRNKEINGESLIKNFLTFEFEKGQDNIVGDLIAKADEMGIPYLQETTVHPSTLEKFIKEKMEKGIKVPVEPFSIYTGRKACIIEPKKKSKSK